MNVELLRAKLSQLITECGGQALEDITVTVTGRKEWRSSADEVFERTEQPVTIEFRVRAKDVGDWQLSSRAPRG